jgi:hypothetical protein
MVIDGLTLEGGNQTSYDANKEQRWRVITHLLADRVNSASHPLTGHDSAAQCRRFSKQAKFVALFPSKILSSDRKQQPLMITSHDGGSTVGVNNVDEITASCEWLLPNSLNSRTERVHGDDNREVNFGD